MQPRLSIVIVNTNTRDWLDGCLASLQSQDIFDELQVVVVENASTDGSAEMVRENYDFVHLVQLDETVGFGSANNAGSKHCTAPILLFLNQDTIVHEASLSTFLGELERVKDRWSTAGGLIYDGNGDLERSTGADPGIVSFFLNRFLGIVSPLRGALGGLSYQHWGGYDRERTVNWVTGAYLWIKRDVFEALNGFDENIFLYCEDVDLCYRARKLGGECIYFPTGSIVHYRSKAPVKRSRKVMQRENLAYLARKHNRGLFGLPTRLAFWVLSKS
jgi:GT2 family glycosyltransferase